MSTALVPTAAPGSPERFANPLSQVRGLLAQPAVRRSLPMAFLIALIAAAALAWMTLSTPTQRTLFTALPDSDKAAVTAALTQGGIDSKVDSGTGALTVAEEDYARARMLLAGQGLPKAAPGGYAILDQLPMGVSRAVEGERLRQARETEIAKSIEEIDAVAEARVHLATPEQSVFVRDNNAPSASVILKLQAGRSLSDAQVASIINLVAASVPGLKPDAVTIVDQLGALLTRNGSTGGAGGETDRIDFQKRMEEKYRQQLTQLLTPLVGAGNFTAEVSADVNLDATQATRESYDRAGQVIRAETGNWTGNQRDGAGGPTAPGGIPGALSNTPPPASTLSTPQAATGNPGTPATPGAAGDRAAVAGGAGVNPEKQSDTYQRAYDNGREVSVTQSTPGAVKRVSVAVLLREPANGRRSGAEVQQITDLVKSAVGFDAARQDQVTVISRKFAAADAGATAGPAWYDNAWLPVLARNATALIIALLVLLLGVRPLAKALMKKRDETPGTAVSIGADGVAVTPPVGLAQLAGAQAPDERLGAVRGFTRDNPARAALAVRDMIRADGK